MNYIKYVDLKKTWPSNGKHILASYDDSTIVVYQAFNSAIAEAAVLSQCFHSDECINSGYKFSRMSWIKPNFLWMMYRCGWTSKKEQTNVLAIRITKQGFDEILSKAKISSTGSTKEAQVVLQWDPDHLPNGEKVTERRAIQLGIRGDLLKKFSSEFIVNITDITDFVKNEYNKCLIDGVPFKDVSELLVPNEKVYVPSDVEICSQIELTVHS